MTMIRPHGFSLFCDDIRREEGGKLSYIGVYLGSIVVHSHFPVSLSKLGVVISFRISAADQNREDAAIHIYLPGDPDDAPSINAALPLSGLPEPNPEKSDKLHRLEAQFLFSPLTLKSPGLIKVRAVREGQVIKLGTISVVEGAKAKEEGNNAKHEREKIGAN